MNSQPFDLDKLDYETRRHQQRRKLLVWSLPFVVVTALLALWFILPTPLTSLAIGSYKHQRYTAARNWLAPLTWTSPEPFIAAYNSGTADSARKAFDRAEHELTRALAIAPSAKRCMVAQNLVYTLDAHAKTLATTLQDTTALKEQANSVVASNRLCFMGASSQGGGAAASNSASSSSNSQSPSDSQQRQLEQKEQEGSERQAQFARDETFDASNADVKPW